jgi:hypothetical protein
MQVDLCVFLAGNKLEEYTPLFIETLFMNCDTSKLHIHVVEKGNFLDYKSEFETLADLTMYQPVAKNIHEYLLNKKAESSIPFSIYEMHDPSLFFTSSRPDPPCYWLGDDHANTLNWSMTNCGTNKWVIFCHSDMIFVGDAVTTLVNDLKDDMGLYGLYNHFYAVNRDAFNKVGVKFNSIDGFRTVPMSPSGDFDYVIRHMDDPRCTPDSKVIYGWDVGELLELMMIAHGWKCTMSQFALSDLFIMIDHLASGHEYTTNEQMKADHARRRANWMRRYGIKRID